MGLFNLFTNKRDLCRDDECIRKTVDFIKVIHSYDRLCCPMFTVTFDSKSILFYFFDSGNTSPCGYKNMLHRKQTDDENAVNRLIGEAIHADELPKGTRIEWHFDEQKNEYDSYSLRHSIIPEHKKCGPIYLKYVKSMCKALNYRFDERGSCLDFHLQ